MGFMEGSKGFEGCGVSSSAAVGLPFLQRNLHNAESISIFNFLLIILLV